MVLHLIAQSLAHQLWRGFLLFMVGLAFVLSVGTVGFAMVILDDATVILKVDEHPIGVSTRYIGACEGNVGFDSADMTDLGINTYRIYGGMSRWEPKDDDGVYGVPAIAHLKANPDLIPWERWDAIMTLPAMGTDYASSGNPQDLWQGSAQTIFETLKREHIRPVVTIRNNRIARPISMPQSPLAEAIGPKTPWQPFLLTLMWLTFIPTMQMFQIMCVRFGNG